MNLLSLLLTPTPIIQFCLSVGTRCRDEFDCSRVSPQSHIVWMISLEQEYDLRGKRQREPRGNSKMRTAPNSYYRSTYSSERWSCARSTRRLWEYTNFFGRSDSSFVDLKSAQSSPGASAYLPKYLGVQLDRLKRALYQPRLARCRLVNLKRPVGHGHPPSQ